MDHHVGAGVASELPHQLTDRPSQINPIRWIRALAGNCLLILLHPSSFGRARLMGAYLRIALKAKLLVDILGRRLTQERIFGQTVAFADYNAFLILFEEIFLTGVYDFPSLTRSPRIIDAGANIGMSVTYFKALYPDCEVIAFEPDPRNYQLLEQNRAANKWQGVKIHNVGLHCREAELSFFDYNDRPGALSNGFWQPEEAGPPKRVTTVHAVPLSAYVANPIDMLKMDIEGSEHDVLEDLQATGKLADIRRITMEYHHHVRPTEDRLGVMLSGLENAGFGYTLRAPLGLPFPERQTQNFMLRAYKK